MVVNFFQDPAFTTVRHVDIDMIILSCRLSIEYNPRYNLNKKIYGWKIQNVGQ